jgi:hypothetical protein
MNDVMLPKPVETREKRKNLPMMNTDDTDLKRQKANACRGLTRIGADQEKRMSDLF